MKFKLIATLERPEFKDEDDAFWSDEAEEYRDKIEEVMAKSDLMVQHWIDGSTTIATKVNFRGGLCDCCKEVPHRREALKLEFFVQED